ncbi:MAG: nucleoside deaminase [Ignavibacteria bacterium]|nr:nucleoside deaminase [Ignavibacteria bacterium]
MQKAIELSRQNVREGRGGPFAAVVVRDNAIIARGTNLVTSTNDPTAHAEVVAIREACRVLGSFQLTDCDIFTTCEPCPMCMGAIYWARPRTVYYANTRDDAAAIGFDDEFLYTELAAPLPQRRIPMIQVMRQEALEAFREWERKEDRIPY